MFVDAHEFEDGEERSFDVCIVGAGAAGITLARTLRDSGLSVGVLESGGFDLEPATQDLYRGTMSGLGTWELDDLRFRIFGGSTSAWAGWCKPLAPEDFEERPWMPGGGWPFDFFEIEPYYAAANQVVEIGPALWDGAALAEAEGFPLLLPDSERIVTRMFQFSPPTQFGVSYRKELELAKDVQIVLHANVVEVVLTPDLGVVDRLSCSTLEGIDFTVRANTFVLATGGIETPRILLASNRQLPEGVANSSDAVGRYFMEHPHYRDSAAWVMNGTPNLRFYEVHRTSVAVGDAEFDGVAVRGMLELSADVLRAEELPSFTARVMPARIQGIEPMTPPMVAAMLKAEADGQVFTRLTLHSEQRPDPDSRITLRPDDLDELGVPRADPDWRIGVEDLRGIQRGLEVLGAEIGAAAAGRLWIPTKGGGIDWIPVPGGHHMGTARMSDDPADGVVDGDGLCHDLDNLYILSSATFPTGGNANPTLTIVALALRMADHLREAS